MITPTYLFFSLWVLASPERAVGGTSQGIRVSTVRAYHLLAVCPIISFSSILEFNPSQGFQRQIVFDSAKALSLQRWYLHLFRGRCREARFCIPRRAKRLSAPVFTP
jgi:hypothetical protein